MFECFKNSKIREGGQEVGQSRFFRAKEKDLEDARPVRIKKIIG